MPRSNHTGEPHRSAARSVTARFEEVSAAAAGSCGVFLYDRPRCERGWHYHPEAELTLILESAGRRFVGDHIGTYEPGDLVLLGPNLPHLWRDETVALPRRQRARSIYVHFQTGWLDGTSGVMHELDEVRRLLARAAQGLRFTGPVREHATREMPRLLELSGMRRLLAFLALLQDLAEAGGGEALSTAGFAPALDQFACERIRKIHSYVYQNFRSGIAHQEVARLAGLSPAALSKFFRRTTGRTLTEFINEVRVGDAARQLIDTTENVSDIAYAAGFASLAHFNSTFRRMKQVNPSRFRELRRMPC